MKALLHLGRAVVGVVAVLAAASIGLAGCGPVQFNPNADSASATPAGPNSSGPIQRHIPSMPPPPVMLDTVLPIQHTAVLDTSLPRDRGAFPAVTVSCALPRKDTKTGVLSPGETLLGGGYRTSGSIEVRDSFPSTPFGEPVADGSPAFAWTVVFGAGANPTGTGVVWANCSADPNIGTRVYAQALGGNPFASAVCPADRSISGGGYRSGWDVATTFAPRMVASYPDPSQHNAWTVWETIVNYDADSHPRPAGTAYVVCVNSALPTTVVDGPPLNLPPDPAMSLPPDKNPECTKPGLLLSTCFVTRNGDLTLSCPAGRVIGASAITLRSTTHATTGLGPKPPTTWAIDDGLWLTATQPNDVEGTGAPTWSLHAQYRQSGGPNDALLVAPMALRTLVICAG